MTIITHDTKIIGPKVDKDIRLKYQKILEGQGMNFMFETKIVNVKKCDNCVKFQVADKDGNNKREVQSIFHYPDIDGLSIFSNYAKQVIPKIYIS